MDPPSARNAARAAASSSNSPSGHRRLRGPTGSGSSTSSGISSTSTGAIERSLRQHAPEAGGYPAGPETPSPLRCFLNALSRKKPLDCRTDTNLNRCLNMLDLTALGVGSTLGLGLYVLAGQVASKKAGPGVVVSFGLAAVASAFSALCYAEFAGLVPRAGSAYAYSYITVGEFVAFVIGWNLILEYVIGCSSVARGFSEYLRSLYENLFEPSVSNINISHFNSTSNPVAQLAGNGSLAQVAAAATATTTTGSGGTLQAIADYLFKYFDWPSLVIITVITLFVLFGVKESTNVTMFFTGLNLFVVFVVVCSSLTSLDLRNWQLEQSQVPPGHGSGGFLPYGWSGVLAGSATCFFGFIGFDTIASSAEEAKNPKRNVPISIILSLFISFLAYMSIAIVQTLLWPYYDQDNTTILPWIFQQLQMPLVHWIVLGGAIAGLASSQLGGMYPLPRILYSMANDKLIYSQLAHVNKRLKLPVRATIVGSIFIALLSCSLDIQDLADMVSIGTLAAYSLVSLSVLILRYENRQDAIDDSTILGNNLNHLTFSEILNTIEQSTTESSIGSKFQENSCDNNNNHNKTTTIKDDDGFAETSFDSCKASKQSKSRPKLAPKPSTPIREKGSRPLVAQLSVGFNSWFKNQESSTTVAQNNLHQESPSNHKQFGYLDLLISWRADDDLKRMQPSDRTSKQSKILISIIVILTILLDLVAIFSTNQPSWLFQRNLMMDPAVMLKALGCILLVSLAAVMLMLSRLPTGQRFSSGNNNDMFQVPLVPLIPTLSILVNTLLMLNLGYLTWVRFTVWMTIGLFIYFTYGIWNSEGYFLYLDR